MTASVNSGICDPRLSAFFDADTEERAAGVLEDLLAGDVGQTMHATVSRTLKSAPWAHDSIDDIVSEAQLSLVRRLSPLRQRADPPIQNLLAYATTVAERACYSFLRHRFPERTRLTNQIRYALKHHPAIAFTADTEGRWRCQATGIRQAVRPGSTTVLLDTPARFVDEQQIDVTSPITTLVFALLTACDRAVEFDRLVEVVAVLRGVADEVFLPAEETPDQSVRIDTALEHRASLRAVWHELVTLPVRQRAALLLNLRDPEGGSMLQMLPSTDVVSRADIARALTMTDAQLEGLWERLPLDDLAIAGRLGITRQQVINLRKSGRARLARRLSVISTSVPRQPRQREPE